MEEYDSEEVHPTEPERRSRKSGRHLWVFVRSVRDALIDDIAHIWVHFRLFFGVLLAVIGLLSFSSGRYCDGNTSTYYTCTRPATYYYFPLWAIILVVMGSFGILLWYLRRDRR